MVRAQSPTRHGRGPFRNGMPHTIFPAARPTKPFDDRNRSSLTSVDRDADTRQLFRLHQACESPGPYPLEPRAEPRPAICVNRVAPSLRYAVSCAEEDSHDTHSRFDVRATALSVDG